MKSIIWSIILVVAILGMIYLSILMKNTFDLMYALLSGSIVGAGFSLIGMLKMNANEGLKIFMISVLSAGITWFVVVQITILLTISLFGNTAMLYDLVLGILGAVTGASLAYSQLQIKTEHTNSMG